jgi:hypothetical protein
MTQILVVKMSVCLVASLVFDKTLPEAEVLVKHLIDKSVVQLD